MSESTFSYKGYELSINFDADAVTSECKAVYYYWKLQNVGDAITKFIEFIDGEYQRRLALEKILQYQQEIREKQDNLEAYLEELGYSFYTYTIPGNKEYRYRVAVHNDYQEAFQKDKNRDYFPNWAVIHYNSSFKSNY